MSKRSSLPVLVTVLLLVCAALLPAQDLAAAKQLLADGKYAEAQAAYKALVDQESVDQFQVRLGLGWSAYRLGDTDTAVFQAGRAQGLKSDDLEAAELLGRSLVAAGHQRRVNQSDPTGMYEQGIGELKTVLASDRASAELWQIRGDACWWLGKLEDSAKAYAQAGELDKKNPSYPFMSSTCYLNAGKFAEAEAMAKKALALAPKNARAAYEMQVAKALHGGGKEKEAAPVYANALGTGQLSEQEKGNAARWLWQCHAGNQDWDGLLKNIEIWRKKQPRSGLAWWWTGYVQLTAGKSKESLQSWQKLEKIGGKYTGEAAAYQGICHEQLGEIDKAEKAYVKAATVQTSGWSDQLDPVLKLHGMAGAHFSNGKFERACEIGGKVALPVAKGMRRLNLLSDLGLFHRDWGSSLEARGKKQAARKQYQASLDYYEKAVNEMGNFSLQQFPNSSRAQFQNDYALMFQYHFADNETAVKNYKKALEYDETNTDACLNYGRVLARLGKLDEALAITQKGQPRGDLNALIGQIKRQMSEK